MVRPLLSGREGGPVAPERRSRPLRVAVVTNAFPHYRADFYRALFAREDLEVRVFCRASLPGSHLTLVHDRFPEHVTLVPWVGLPNEWLGWQRLPWRELLSSYDTLFVMGNPRILSHVVLAVLARMLGRHVVIWGQAHTAGASALTERLRLAWWRGFDHFFVYTDGEVGWLKERGFARKHVMAMNNGLDQRRIDAATGCWDAARLTAWQHEQGLTGRLVVLSCARLEPKNRFDLWLEAMPTVRDRFPGLLWCVIGEGREREALEARAVRLGLTNDVRWLGALLEPGDLAPWFLSSRVLVHPSQIGLSLLHAFGHGLPVVTHDNPAEQMPEFSAFESGRTGLAYRHGSVPSLAETVCRILADEPARQRMSASALRIPREDYNVQVMVERFADMASSSSGMISSHLEGPVTLGSDR